MALYLPRQRIVLDIVDDPCSAPVDLGAFPGLTVVPVTCDQMAALAAGEGLADIAGQLGRKAYGSQMGCPDGVPGTGEVMAHSHAGSEAA